MATFRQIHITFWQDPFIEKLKPLQKYFYLYLMTNSKTKQCGCYEISMKLIKYETGLTQKEIDSYIELLIAYKKIDFNRDNQEFLLINWLKHNSFKSPKVKKCIYGELENIKTSVFKDYINSIINKNMGIDSLSIVYNKSIDTGPQEEEEEEEEKEEKNNNIVIDIIEYLNLIADKSYKHNSKSTIKYINARIEDGFVLDDFKKVIDIKVNQWKDDKKMNKFIRPETLFSNKFEGYLNEESTNNNGINSNVNYKNVYDNMPKEF